MKYLTCRTLFLALFLLTAAAPPHGTAGEIVVVDGVEHVRNGERPSAGTERLRLEELWRAGGENDEENMFGLVTKVAETDAGEICLLDPQMMTVHVYSPEGDHLGDLFREGEGPGEVRFPRDMCVLPGGDVVVIQPGPNGLVMVDREGAAAGSRPVRTRDELRLMPYAVNAGGGNTVAAVEEMGEGRDPGTGTRVSSLVSLDEAGRETARYLSTGRSFDYNHHSFSEKESFPDFMWSHAVDGAGRVYALPEREDYAINVFSPAGDLLRVIERPFAPVRRTTEDAARIRRLAERRFRTFPGEMAYEYEETEPIVSWQHRGLQVDAEGRLWVRHARSARDLPEDTLLIFDVFDPQGHFVKQTALLAPGDGRRDGVFLLADDRVLVVRGFVDAMRDWFGGGRGTIGEGDDAESPAPIEIICYRIRR